MIPLATDTSPDRFGHRLAAIVSADVVGYSRLMSHDEVATVRTLTAYRSVMADLVQGFGGQVVDFVGDNMLAEFSSALSAVRCSSEIQRTLETHNAELPEERRMRFRIGIHAGEILADRERIYGDGINIAARLEGLAAPGGICISDVVHKQVRNQPELGFVDLGEKTVKNIPDAVRVFEVRSDAHPRPSDSGSATRAAEPALPLPNKPSLAVLPFVNLSDDPAQDYFSHGLTMDVMTALVKIPGLFLISDLATFSYKSRPVTVREFAQRLGVQYVLEGGVQRSGDRVRILVQLIEAANGRRVWAERFDRDLGDLFAVQDEITEQIVTAMDVKIHGGETVTVLRRSLRNREALECFYRGWEALFGPTREDVEEAQRMFEETIRLEPESPMGYALAGWAHWWAALQGMSRDRARSLQRAMEFCDEALRRDDRTGLPYLIMAQVHLSRGEHETALREAEKAVLERPSCEGTYALKASILNSLGRPEEAVGLAQLAMRLTPIYPPFYPAVLATSYYLCGRYGEAITAAERVRELDPGNVEALAILICAHSAQGNPAAAKSWAETLLRVKPGFSLEAFAASQPYKDVALLDGMVGHLRSAGLQ